MKEKEIESQKKMENKLLKRRNVPDIWNSDHHWMCKISNISYFLQLLCVCVYKSPAAKTYQRIFFSLFLFLFYFEYMLWNGFQSVSILNQSIKMLDLSLFCHHSFSSSLSFWLSLFLQNLTLSIFIPQYFWKHFSTWYINFTLRNLKHSGTHVHIHTHGINSIFAASELNR